jgi:hypothetical protein
LIKRLFKKAEDEGDDPLMARFLVLFDRSIRRVRRTRRRTKYQIVAAKDEARALETLWEDLGFLTNTATYTSQLSEGAVSFHLVGRKVVEVVSTARQTTMPRGRMIEFKRRWDSKAVLLQDWAVRWYRLAVGEGAPEADIRKLPSVLEQMKTLRLFSVATRNYLRRRAWRYFRKLGKTHPERYIAAAIEALALYVDEDASDGLALLDNWGLVHILFHHSEALEAKPHGWTTQANHSLGELAPAPIFEGLWKDSPGAVVGLLTNARSTVVRRWAIRRVEVDLAAHRSALSLDGWLGLLGHDDPGVVALAAGMLDEFEGLETLEVDRWIALAESTDPSALEALCELIAGHVGPDRVTSTQAVRLAVLRPLPVAKLGFSWLKDKAIGPDDLGTVLRLVDAECEPLRPEILGWLRGVLAASAGFERAMVLEFLDARHADARREGWAWFQSEPRLRDDVETWRKLLESPHDDIRLALVSKLEARAGGGFGETEGLRALWAAVLLNVHRGSRAKPGVVNQVLRRLEASPDEAPKLLPLLGVALRSVRDPERRSALVAIVQLVERRGEVAALVRSSFPELQIT